jgi:Amt family ammonium transporter
MSDSDDVPQCNIDSGDTTWVLVSTILVLGMMPALAMFEAGLLRSKNTLSLVTQIIGGLVVLGFLWDVIGMSHYSGVLTSNAMHPSKFLFY